MLQATLTGNMGRDPEIKMTQKGDPYAIFSVACSIYEKGAKGTVWVNVSCFNKNTVEFIQNYGRKGSKCLVRGEVRARAYTTQAGEAGCSLDVTIGGFNGDFELLNKPEEASGSPNVPSPAASSGMPADATAGIDLDDEVPF